MTVERNANLGADRTAHAEGVAQIVIMFAIGCAAGAASFTHVHDVAAAHGQDSWLAWADAVVLELMSIASGLELRRRKRHDKSVAFPAAVLVVSVALSLAAQVVEAEPSLIGWIAAALPAAGFLTMVKIALGRALAETDHHPGAVPDHQLLSLPRAQDADRPDGDGPQDQSTRSVCEVALSDVESLVPAGLVAAAGLVEEGLSLSRQALAKRLRDQGHPVSNARASALVRAVRERLEVETGTTTASSELVATQRAA